ncbi:hypothetical protein [Desulfogranum marinum]|uniref:hypothetical protein n=1 Tax=Desulfogranum marinum TaxID=453220 RepID=UPI001962B85C|nr:hypothetical protein [Desulfogranum marinum]MBM9514549.1 hypothetical protein [Desulfogranum marinum]
MYFFIPSLLRIVATLLIFIFHFQGLYGLDNTNIDFLAICIFCFLSGFLAYPIEGAKLQWFFKKYIQIMAPFWTVYIGVVCINLFIQYKGQDLISFIVTFFFGGLFIVDPLYVISWFITFILVLYLMLAVCTSSESIYINLMYGFLSACCYYFFVKQSFFYLAFFVVGCIAKNSTSFSSILKMDYMPTVNVNLPLGVLQDRCYSFFLIHGCVLLFFVKMIDLRPSLCFIFSLVITSFLSHYHYLFSKNIYMLIIKGK